jgi:hypothetical protein
MPSLVAHKQRKLELRAGAPAARGRKGATANYSLTAIRAAEREMTAQAETAYRTMVANWQPARPASRSAATKASAKDTIAGGRGRQHRDATPTPSPG